MKRSIGLIVLLITVSLIGYSQNINHSDSLLSRHKAGLLIHSHFESIVKNNKYLLLSIADKWYLIIVEKHDFYEEFFVNIDNLNNDTIKIRKKIKKTKKILKQAFNTTLYLDGFVDFNSDFFKDGYELAEGNITYFYLSDTEGNKFGETRLSVFVKPNPIEEGIYRYLMQKLLHYITNENCVKN